MNTPEEKQTPSVTQLERIVRAIEMAHTVKQYDNKKLLWFAMQTGEVSNSGQKNK